MTAAFQTAYTNLFCSVMLSINQQTVKNLKNLESNTFEKIKKSFLSHIRFYLEDDDHKPVDFNGKTISFTCQLIKI